MEGWAKGLRRKGSEQGTVGVQAGQLALNFLLGPEAALVWSCSGHRGNPEFADLQSRKPERQSSQFSFEY